MHEYDDIINLPRPTSKRHLRMPMLNRAAQFAPFAALTGYDDAIGETARLTDNQIQIVDESLLRDLNQKISLLRDSLGDSPLVTIAYFVPDLKKEGGRYAKRTGTVKKIDDYCNLLVFSDGSKIPIHNIMDIKLHPANGE